MRRAVRRSSLPVLLALLTVGVLATGCDTSGLADQDARQTSVEGATSAQSNSPPGPSAAPGREGPPEAGQGSGRYAEVRVGHLSPDAGGVDIYVGKDPDGSPPIGGLTYPNFAPNSSGDYLRLSAGTYDLAVTPAGASAPQVIDVDGVQLNPNRDYTVLAIGELSPEGNEPGIQALPLVDNADEETALPPRDKTLVRFVHASPDAGAVNIAVDGTTVLSGVTFSTASGYLEVEPGTRTIKVRKDGSSVLTLTPTLKAGTKITAYVIGNATPESGDAPLSGTTTVDAVNPAGSGPVGAKKGPPRR